MTLGCISQFLPPFLSNSFDELFSALVIPAAYHSSKVNGDPFPFGQKAGSLSRLLDDVDTEINGLLVISRGTAILLLLVYASYLWFQVRHVAVSMMQRLIASLNVAQDACPSIRGKVTYGSWSN